MSSGTESWERLLTKNEPQELPEVTEQLKMLKEKSDRIRRILKVLLVAVIGIVLMVVGVILIGDWSDSFMSGSALNKGRLEVGILLSIFGTVTLTLSLMYLVISSKR